MALVLLLIKTSISYSCSELPTPRPPGLLPGGSHFLEKLMLVAILAIVVVLVPNGFVVVSIDHQFPAVSLHVFGMAVFLAA